MLTKNRELIVNEAVEWLGTPYKGWGRCKSYGADCIGFVAGVFQNCGLIPKDEVDAAIPKDYSLQIGQHQEDTEYVSGILKFMVEIQEHEIQPGDVIMFKLRTGRAYAHSAIAVNYPLIIHAIAHGGVTYADARKHPLLRGSRCRFFTLR